MPGEGVPDGAILNIPHLEKLSAPDGSEDRICGTYSDQLVLSSGSKVLAVRAEANAPDIQVAARVGTVVLQNADLFSSDDVVDLSRLVASGRDVLAIHAEANAAHNALMGQSMDQVDIQHARDGRVENHKPVVASLLVLRRKALNVQVSQRVGGRRLVRVGHSSVVGGRMGADLRRLARARGARIWNGRIDLGRSRSARIRGPSHTALPRAGASGAGRRLGREAARSGTLRVLRLERRLLLRRRRRGRRALESWGRLRHLMRRRLLLLLLGRRGRRNGTTLAALASHDGAEGIGAHANGRRRSLRRAGVRRAHHGVRGRASAGLVELATEMGDLFFVPVGRELSVSTYKGDCEAWQRDILLLESHVVLLHGIDLLADQLHFVDLGLDCDGG